MAAAGVLTLAVRSARRTPMVRPAGDHVLLAGVAIVAASTRPRRG
jgi:hypothetical protein